MFCSLLCFLSQQSPPPAPTTYIWYSPLCQWFPNHISSLDFSLESVPHFYLPDRFLFLDVISFISNPFYQHSFKFVLLPHFSVSINDTTIFSDSKTNFRVILDTSFLLPFLSNQWSSDVNSVFTSFSHYFCHHHILGNCRSLDFWSSLLIGLQPSVIFPNTYYTILTDSFS